MIIILSLFFKELAKKSEVNKFLNFIIQGLDKKGFSVASGSACSSNNNEPSHVLLAMGVDMELAQGAIRVSLGVDSNPTQVEEFIAALKTEVDRLKQLTAMAA